MENSSDKDDGKILYVRPEQWGCTTVEYMVMTVQAFGKLMRGTKDIKPESSPSVIDSGHGPNWLRGPDWWA